jgi:glycosyltransferase involved in cell wall biosynthesis
MVMDNPWSGSMRQRIGAVVSPFYVRAITDAVWLPGERQATFARRLGFEQSEILRGSFSCDSPAFEIQHNSRIDAGRPVPRAFLYVGRFSPEKGVQTLADGYRQYRELTEDPWPLVCCGSGPMRNCLENVAGIQLVGFLQPCNVPAMMGNAGCLIMPSDWDHWGVAVHEAAAAGLLILASEQVGAAVHLVQPRFNGFIFGCRDVKGLSRQMAEVSAMSDAQLDQMSRASHWLSKQFSPKQWADILLRSYTAYLADREAKPSKTV